MTTGEKIKMARTEWKWSQSKLAREVGISRNSMRRIENGESANFTAKTAVRIADVLSLELDYLLRP